MPPAKTKAAEAVEEQKELLDKIEPDRSHKQWTIGTGENAKTYTQKPLSYFSKLEFYALLADAIDKAMESSEGGDTGLAGLIDNVSSGGAPFSDADSLLRPLIKLVRFVPDIFEEAYCIFLAVPRGDRYMVKEMMRAPDDEGGLSDDQGFAIVQTFIDQNLEAIEEFFTGQIPKLARRAKSLSKKLSPDTK